MANSKNNFRVFNEDLEQVSDREGNKNFKSLVEAAAVIEDICDGSDRDSHDMFFIKDSSGKRYGWDSNYTQMVAPRNGEYREQDWMTSEMYA